MPQPRQSCTTFVINAVFGGEERKNETTADQLTQVAMEKNEKATVARAASWGIPVTSCVRPHRLASRQKHTNHRKVHTPGKQTATDAWTLFFRLAWKYIKHARLKIPETHYCWKRNTKAKTYFHTTKEEPLHNDFLLPSAGSKSLPDLRHCIWISAASSSCLTWEPQVRHDNVFPVLWVAHKRHVNIQCQEGYAGQEGDHADAYGVLARRVVLVENAVALFTVATVDVSLCCDAAKHHQGKYLQWKMKQTYTMYVIILTLETKDILQ